MPDILMPIKWLLEAILVGFHTAFTAIGLDGNSGAAWVLSIVGLVLLVRTALIPLFVKQIKSQRNMYAIQPELKKLADKYKGKQDRESREKFAREQMDLYKKHGSSPFSSCLPLVAQMPVFFSLYSILNEAQKGAHGVGALTTDLATSFSHATFLGARLSETFMTATSLSVRILAAVMVILMTSSQFITQRQLMAKNQNPATSSSQFAQTQKIMLYVFPIIFLFSGVFFPLGVMFYWLVSNFWTMGQQFIVIRNMPTPGSIAHKEREARLAKRGKTIKSEPVAEVQQVEEKPAQRTQPVSKARAKKKPQSKGK